jgi:hypothetical protein
MSYVYNVGKKVSLKDEISILCLGGLSAGESIDLVMHRLLSGWKKMVYRVACLKNLVQF